MASLDEMGTWLDDLYARAPPDLLRAEPLTDPDDFGVPRQTQDGEPDEEGNVRWKLLPGTLASSALASLEARVGPLPEALSGWLLARHHLFHQVKTGRGHLLALPPTPVHAPLRRFEETLESWAPLIDAGWLAFGDFDAGAGPLCLALGVRTSPGEVPVVWFDHDDLSNIAPDDRGRRSALAPLAHPLYDSFEGLLADIGLAVCARAAFSSAREDRDARRRPTGNRTRNAARLITSLDESEER